MTKWIRWWGLIAFLVILGVIAVFWFLFIDGIIERTIESEGTRLVGARVDLGGADLSLIPAGLTLSKLEVTDPDEPMTNAIEIENLALTLDGGALLRRKFIVEKMEMQGVRVGTARETSGAVGGQPRSAQESSEEEAGVALPAFTMPSFEVPDVETILANEDLETLKLVRALQADVEQMEQFWTQRVKGLPGPATFDTYRVRIQQLQESTQGGIGGILGGVGEAQALKEDIERDIGSLKNAQTEFEKAFGLLQQRLQQVRKAPQADVRRLQNKYSLSPEGLANLGGTLLGQQVDDWISRGVSWYEKLMPLVARAKQAGTREEGPEVVKPVRGQGVDVRFRETPPLPDFLIRRAGVSLEHEVGDVAGTLENLTPDQEILGKPLTFEFTGDKLDRLDSAALSGRFDHVDPENSQDRASLRLVGYRIEEVTLSDQPDWPVVLQKGLADVRLRVAIKDDALDANLNGNMRSLAIVAGKEGDSNALTGALSSAISGISRLSFKTEIGGTLEQYQVKISSDLDRVLEQAAGNLVRDLSASFGRELSAAVSSKVKGPISELKGNMGQLGGIDQELTNRVSQGEDLIGQLLKTGGASKGLPGGLKLPF